MHIRDFAFADYPAIFGIHQSQHISWPEWPSSPEAWAEGDRHRHPQSRYQRWVAVEDGRVVGFAAYARSPWNYPPQSCSIHVEVLPAYQRRGIGSALYDQVISGVQPLNPPALRADAFANLPQGFAFLEQRGFCEAFRETPVHLDVAAFDPAPFAGVEPQLRAQGITLKTLCDLESDPERDRKLYALMVGVEQDIPHEGDTLEEPDFEDWVTWALQPPAVLPDAFLIAVHGDEYVALRDLSANTAGRILLGGLLGVRRDYRKRGLALALQLRGIAYAREHGYHLIKDCTAVQNAPMQALFNRLGFVRDPEWQQCQKDLPH